MSNSGSWPFAGDKVFDGMEFTSDCISWFDRGLCTCARQLRLLDQFDKKAIWQHEKCDVARAESDGRRGRQHQLGAVFTHSFDFSRQIGDHIRRVVKLYPALGP